MPNNPGEDLRILPVEIIQPLRLADWFPREAPLEVDVGCGAGSFITSVAAQNPERNFLGIERLFGRVRTTCGRAQRAGLDNVRVLRMDNRYAVRYLIPAGSVTVFHALFPDPWPKRRHHRRRLVQPDFLTAARRALKCGGELRIKTDDSDYFETMRSVAATDDGFKIVPWVEPADYPKTDFETAFLRRGLPIYRLRLVAV